MRNALELLRQHGVGAGGGGYKSGDFLENTLLKAFPVMTSHPDYQNGWTSMAIQTDVKAKSPVSAIDTDNYVYVVDPYLDKLRRYYAKPGSTGNWQLIWEAQLSSLYSRYIMATSDMRAHPLVVEGTDAYVLTGTSSTALTRGYILKFDKNGNKLWECDIGALTGNTANCPHFIVRKNAIYVWVGWNIYKISKDGTTLLATWDLRVISPGDNWGIILSGSGFYGFGVSYDEQYFAVGYYHYENSTGNYRTLVFKADGTLLHRRGNNIGGEYTVDTQEFVFTKDNSLCYLNWNSIIQARKLTDWTVLYSHTGQRRNCELKLDSAGRLWAVHTLSDSWYGYGRFSANLSTGDCRQGGVDSAQDVNRYGCDFGDNGLIFTLYCSNTSPAYYYYTSAPKYWGQVLV